MVWTISLAKTKPWVCMSSNRVAVRISKVEINLIGYELVSALCPVDKKGQSYSSKSSEFHTVV